MLHLLILAAAGITAGSADVERLDGSRLSGTLVEWSADMLVFDTPSGRVTCPTDTLLNVRPQQAATAAAPTAPAVWVELVDGSELVGQAYFVKQGVASLKRLDGQPLQIPTRMIAAVTLREPDAVIAKQWQEIRAIRPAGDLLVVAREASIDYLEGVLGDVTDQHVRFRLDDEDIPVNRTKVAGLVYFHAIEKSFDDPVCVVEWLDGTQLRVQSATLEGDQITAVGLSGVKIQGGIESVAKIDFSLGKLIYLSDLQPTSVRYDPYFTVPKNAAVFQWGQPRMDMALEGGPLRLDGQSYAKGLAMRSRTEITYTLPGKFRSFTALAGIDDAMGDRGHVRFVVRADGRRLFEGTLRGSDTPAAMQLDITGVRQLTFLVDYGDDLDVADHLDLCDARISK